MTAAELERLMREGVNMGSASPHRLGEMNIGDPVPHRLGRSNAPRGTENHTREERHAHIRTHLRGRRTAA